MVNRERRPAVVSENELLRRPMNPSSPEGSRPVNGWIVDGAILAAVDAVR
jgi:hypothetical protein